MFNVSVRYILLNFEEDFFNRFKTFLNLRCHAQGEYFIVVGSVSMTQVHGLNDFTISLAGRVLRRKMRCTYHSLSFTMSYFLAVLRLYLIPNANKVWGKVIFSHVLVILFTGVLCMMSFSVWRLVQYSFWGSPPWSHIILVGPLSEREVFVRRTASVRRGTSFKRGISVRR